MSQTTKLMPISADFAECMSNPETFPPTIKKKAENPKRKISRRNVECQSPDPMLHPHQVINYSHLNRVKITIKESMSKKDGWMIRTPNSQGTPKRSERGKSTLLKNFVPPYKSLFTQDESSVQLHSKKILDNPSPPVMLQVPKLLPKITSKPKKDSLFDSIRCVSISMPTVEGVSTVNCSISNTKQDKTQCKYKELSKAQANHDLITIRELMHEGYHEPDSSNTANSKVPKKMKKRVIFSPRKTVSPAVQEALLKTSPLWTKRSVQHEIDGMQARRTIGLFYRGKGL